MAQALSETRIHRISMIVADATIIYGGRSDLAHRDPEYEALIRKANRMPP